MMKNKPLEALEVLGGYYYHQQGADDYAKDSMEYKIVEKSLRALEIIKKKPIVALVDYKYTYEEWLELVDEKDKDLFRNQEEYDLLKEVLL